MAEGRPRSLRALTFGSGKRRSSLGPPSPTFSETTNASAMNFGSTGPKKIITRAHLKANLQAYEDLLNNCAAYRAALITMSKATAGFADAMERCSGLKGTTYEAGTRLQAASGVHHLIGNLWHVLSESLEKNFEKPLSQHLDSYKSVVNERSQTYERSLHEKSRLIRETEMRNMNRKERNLQSFREALAILQRQVDDLDELKATHYREILTHEEEVWDVVQSKVCILVRSEMDIFDRITSKASDPIIEPMLQSVPDPFDSYGPPKGEDQIFSILAPLSIMTAATPSSPTPLTGTTPERDMSLPSSATNKIISWLPGTNGTNYSPDLVEWPSAPSPSSTPPRSNSPPALMHIGNRQNSVPTMQRKNESKLRSVLSSIDEVKPRSESEDSKTLRNLSPSILTEISAPHSQPGMFPSDEILEPGQLTPKHLSSVSSQSTSSPYAPATSFPSFEINNQTAKEHANIDFLGT